MPSSNDKKIAVIAGAGPAGLTAALELLRRSEITPLVFEGDSQVGGISKTINYRGNRMDLGGHRFFSKSDWVMKWWQEILPVAGLLDRDPLRISYQGQSRDFRPDNSNSAESDAVMLVRQRLSRIFYRRRFFDYPLKLNAAAMRNMGLAEIARVGLSYTRSKIARRNPERSLEDFLVNRFGERLYLTFFKDYTEKVWGVPCTDISAEWGAQRIKGLSVTKALAHAITSPLRTSTDTYQRKTETSLIERFLYPKLGPGQMWETVASRVEKHGGQVFLKHHVIGLKREDNKVRAAVVRDARSGETREVACDHFVSTMPVSELVNMLEPGDARVAQIAGRLPYRDFMSAGLLLKSMRMLDQRSQSNGMPPDNWIYIQESDVRIGRLQVFNNWSPTLVADPSTIWLGLEYFCNESDDIWSMTDSKFLSLASAELEKIGMIDASAVLDGTVVRVKKAYPAYFGEYSHFHQVRDFLDTFSNLYPIGRNGMHRYNNQDHSMLAAQAAVSAILCEGSGKSAIWQVNTEEAYHEDADARRQP